jgi:RND family efflux transporter MFP subunit
MLATAALTASAGPDAVPVAVTRAVKAPVVEQVPINGTVTSSRSALLSASIGGLVRHVHVDAGDRVEAGDVVVALDAELADKNLQSARAAARRALRELADARRRLDEANNLEQRSISASEVRSLEAEVEIDAAEAERLQAEAEHQAATLERHNIKAPFSGVIAQKLTEAGEWVSPGTGVAELVAMEGLRLDYRVPQEYYPRLDEDTEVVATLDALPDRRFAGRIAAAVPVSDPSARTFLLRVTLEDPSSAALTPGMSTHGLLRLDTGKQGVVVPRDALLRYPDGRVTVWAVDDSGDTSTVSERQVQPGLSFDGRVEIRQGLEAGTTVVVEGNEALQENQTVEIKETTE